MDDLNLNMAAILALTPITVAVVSGCKTAVKALTPYAFFVALAVGEGLTWLSAGADYFGLETSNWAAVSIVGLMVGLSSSGLWSGLVSPAKEAITA